ncbi:MAG: hypothetical protein ACOYT7_01955 [Patescibacteria group bacterium]
MDESQTKIQETTPAPTGQTPPPALTPTPTPPPTPEIASPPPVPTEPKKKNVILWVAVGLFVLALLAIMGYVVVSRGLLVKTKACTQEIKVCPDGTSVGRVGPNCEFAPCPTPATTPTATASATPTASPSASPTP